MYNKKQIRKILLQQKLMKFYAKMIIKKANKHSKERFVTTSRGDIRVREYGFESDQVKPLFIDLHGVGIGRHSAGANFTAVMCMMAKESGDFSIKYQILDYPPMDMFIDPATKSYPKGAVPLKDCIMYNICYYDNDPETAKNPYLSPVFATPEQLASQPPTLLIVAGMDSLHDEGGRYGEMLKAAGIPLEFYDFKNAAHGFTLKESEDSTKAQNIMAEFISKHSK